MNKIISILIVFVAILYQTDSSESNNNGPFKGLMAASFRSPVDRGLKKLRLFYSNKYSRKALLRTTITVSSTSTSFISTALYCARFQNNGVTGACRRRKQLLHDSKVGPFNDSPGDEVQPTQVLNR